MVEPRVLKVTSDDPDLRWYRRGRQELRLADAVDDSHGAAMTVGFGRYAAGESNEWVTSYDEALVVTRGVFAVDSDGGSTVARAGDQCFFITVTFARSTSRNFSGRLADDTPISCVTTASGVITGR